MPSDVPLRALLRRLRYFGADCRPTRHGHYKVSRRGFIYTFPTVRGRYVRALYIPKIRRKLRLTPENGVTDDEFWGKKRSG